jgi:hypothetical protein
MRTLLLCLSLLLSCGAPMAADQLDMASPVVIAGSRLTPLYFKGTDGTKIPSMWFIDKQTGKRCALNGGFDSGAGIPSEVYCADHPGAPAGNSIRFTLEP